MNPVVLCDICGQRVAPYSHYVVKMEIYADPAVPPVTTDDLTEKDFDQSMDDLIDQMKHMTADDLQDQVHRRFEFRVCPACQPKLLANPLGLPRTTQSGAN